MSGGIKMMILQAWGLPNHLFVCHLEGEHDNQRKCGVRMKVPRFEGLMELHAKRERTVDWLARNWPTWQTREVFANTHTHSPTASSMSPAVDLISIKFIF